MSQAQPAMGCAVTTLLRRIALPSPPFLGS